MMGYFSVLGVAAYPDHRARLINVLVKITSLEVSVRLSALRPKRSLPRTTEQIPMREPLGLASVQPKGSSTPATARERTQRPEAQKAPGTRTLIE
jgi:hypothetical protein